VSIPVHPTNSALSYLQSPITTSPSCWRTVGGLQAPRGDNAIISPGPAHYLISPKFQTHICWTQAHSGPICGGHIKPLWQNRAEEKGLSCVSLFYLLLCFLESSLCLTYSPVLPFPTHTCMRLYLIYFCVGGLPSQMSVSTPRRTKYLNFCVWVLYCLVNRA
jgi:hypothetical protein